MLFINSSLSGFGLTDFNGLETDHFGIHEEEK